MSVPRDTVELSEQQIMAIRTILGSIASSKNFTAADKTHFVTSYGEALKLLRLEQPIKNLLVGLQLGLRMWATD